MNKAAINICIQEFFFCIQEFVWTYISLVTASSGIIGSYDKYTFNFMHFLQLCVKFIVPLYLSQHFVLSGFYFSYCIKFNSISLWH